MNKEVILFGLVAIVFISFLVIASNYGVVQTKGDLKSFSSYDEMKDFIQTNTESYGYYNSFGGSMAVKQMSSESVGMSEPSFAPTSDSARGGTDYSTTNIQVLGVDEADTVKNDAKYIYTISGRKVVIIDAYPAQSARNVSEIDFSGTPQQIFVNGDRLIVFGWEDYTSSGVSIPELGIMPRYSYVQKTFIDVYDITDRANPILTRNVSIDGSYYQSRMIGDYVYAIVNENINYYGAEPIPMPMIRSDGVEKTIAPTDIYYFDYPDSSYIFTNIVSLNAKNDGQEIQTKTFLMGYSENMYVSNDNIFIVHTKRQSQYDFYDRVVDEVILPTVPLNVQVQINEARNSNATKYDKIQLIGKIFQEYIDSLGPQEGARVMKEVQLKAEKVQEDIAKEMEKTVIHKIGISNGNIDYKTSGDAPGYVLNQFSMDEYNGNFRIATTTGNWGGNTANNVYILDSNLQIVGRLEDLAKGERIYSVRFMGEKAYLVTFKQIDPLFVIDMSNPTAPAVLGYLKIPGVSQYLHPYDDTHIIGVGNNASEEGRINGLKLSLFDVSDFANPREVSSYVIGGKDTYASSDALYDHKAFLFDKAKNLMVIPVSVNTYPRGLEVSAQQPTYWQGAFVFDIDLSGIALRGNVTHENEAINKSEYYYYDYNAQIRRSLYIDNVLYTVSSAMVKANDLATLQEISKVMLPSETYYPYPMYASSTAGSVEMIEVPSR